MSAISLKLCESTSVIYILKKVFLLNFISKLLFNVIESIWVAFFLTVSLLRIREIKAKRSIVNNNKKCNSFQQLLPRVWAIKKLLTFPIFLHTAKAELPRAIN